MSYKNDIVLDPFNGAGTTCIAAGKAHRQYVGIDINEEYNTLAKRRITNATAQTSLKKYL